MARSQQPLKASAQLVQTWLKQQLLLVWCPQHPGSAAGHASTRCLPLKLLLLLLPQLLLPGLRERGAGPTKALCQRHLRELQCKQHQPHHQQQQQVQALLQQQLQRQQQVPALLQQQVGLFQN
jgi:hypothetical protein